MTRVGGSFFNKPICLGTEATAIIEFRHRTNGLSSAIKPMETQSVNLVSINQDMKRKLDALYKSLHFWIKNTGNIIHIPFDGV